jgi:hypothetical protein
LTASPFQRILHMSDTEHDHSKEFAMKNGFKVYPLAAT